VDGVSSNTLVWLVSRLSEQCVNAQCGLAGSCFGRYMVLDLRLYQVSRGVVVMGQDCNYQLDITKKESKVHFYLYNNIKNEHPFRTDPRTTRPIPYKPGWIQIRSDMIQVRKAAEKSYFKLLY
jgi:hypothetical protein